MQKKSYFAFAGIISLMTAISVTPGLARQAQKSTNMTSYQLQSASSSYAFAPQTVATTSRSRQCWIATDASRPYGYMDTCANPLTYDPALNPVYYGELHGE